MISTVVPCETIESADRDSQSAWVSAKTRAHSDPASFAQAGASTGTPGRTDVVSATGGAVVGVGGVGSGTCAGTSVPASGSTAPHDTEDPAGHRRPGSRAPVRLGNDEVNPDVSQVRNGP